MPHMTDPKGGSLERDESTEQYHNRNARDGAVRSDAKAKQFERDTAKSGSLFPGYERSLSKRMHRGNTADRRMYERKMDRGGSR